MTLLTPMRLPLLAADPLVSVLVTNYNYAEFLPVALDSVLGQSYSNLEVVVVDDGSTDASRDVLAEYARRDERVRPVLQENGGLAVAMNRAFEESRGQVVCLLDADDAFDRTKVARAVQAFRDDASAGFLVHRMLRVDREGRSGGVVPTFARLPEGWLGEDLLRAGGVVANLPSCSALVLRREVAEAVYPIPPWLRRNADVVVHRVAPLLTRVIALDLPLTRYRFHGANLTNAVRWDLAFLDRERAMYERLWQVQHEYLECHNPEAAQALTPLEASVDIEAHDLLRSRVAGDGSSWARYRRMRRHPGFAAIAPERRLVYAVVAVTPRSLYLKIEPLLWGQNGFKRVVSGIRQIPRTLRSRQRSPRP